MGGQRGVRATNRSITHCRRANIKTKLAWRGNNEMWHGNEYKNCMMTIAVDVLVE